MFCCFFRSQEEITVIAIWVYVKAVILLDYAKRDTTPQPLCTVFRLHPANLSPLYKNFQIYCNKLFTKFASNYLRVFFFSFPPRFSYDTRVHFLIFIILNVTFTKKGAARRKNWTGMIKYKYIFGVGTRSLSTRKTKKKKKKKSIMLS